MFLLTARRRECILCARGSERANESEKATVTTDVLPSLSPHLDVGVFFPFPSFSSSPSTFFRAPAPPPLIIHPLRRHRHTHDKTNTHLGWSRSASSSIRPRSSARTAGKSRRRRSRRRLRRCSTAAPRSALRHTACPRTLRRPRWSSGARYTSATSLQARRRARGASAPRRRGTAASPASSSTAEAGLLLLLRALPLPPPRPLRPPRSRDRSGKEAPRARPS